MKPREIKKLTSTLKAIADPTRREIYNLVLTSDKQESISTVAKEFKITRQGITKHLKMLQAGGLIELKRIGRVTYCNAETEALSRVKQWVATIELDIENPNQETNATELKPEPQKSTTHESSEAEINEEEIVEAAKSILNPTEKDLEEQPVEVIDQGTEKEDEEMKEEHPQLLQMSIDPNDPGTPVMEEPLKEEPLAKEPKEKAIEVTENQLDIYGIRKEPKANDDQQFELF